MGHLDNLPTLTDQPRRAQPKSAMTTRVEAALDREKETARLERQWEKEIDARDGRQCRACGKHTDPDAKGLLRGHRAHIVYASACGSMEPCNRVTLCPRCHQDEHKDKLRFTADGGPYVGVDANRGLEFWRKDEHGEWYLSRREIAPHLIEKD